MKPVLNKPGFKAWLVWGIASSIVLYQLIYQCSVSVMVPLLMRKFDIDLTQVGFLSSSFFYSYVLMQIPSGLLVDAFGPKKVILSSIVLSTIGCLGASYCTEFYQVVISRLLIGITTAPALSVALYLGARWFPWSMFALIAGLTESLGMLGGAAGEQILSFLVEGGYGFSSIMKLCSVTGLVLTILVLFFISDKGENSDEIDNTPPVKPKIFKDLVKFVFTKQILLNGFFASLTFCIITAFAGLWCIPYIRDVYDISVVHAATASSLVFIGAAIGTPIFGRLADIYNKRRVLMMVGCILAEIFMVAILFPDYFSLTLIKIFLFCLGLTSSCYVLPFVLVKERAAKHLQGSAMGYTNMMCIIIGAPILQPLIGAILHKDTMGQVLNYTPHDYRIALMVLPICFLGALVISYFVEETK